MTAVKSERAFLPAAGRDLFLPLYDPITRLFGFDAARDVMAITVNRWPHGYALGANSLFDPLWPDEEAPHVIGRRRFGRIAIANSDASGIDLTQTAFDEAHRAVGELMSRRFGYFSRI